MIHLIVWLIVSGIAGFIASKLVNKSGSGLLMDILLGIVGGFVGGFIVQRVPALERLAGAGANHHLIVEGIVALLGAMLVIFAYDLVVRRRA